MYDCDSLKARVQKFDDSHGESLVDAGMILFADGASRETAPYGAWQEPPPDPWECAKLILHFWRLKLARAVDKFNREKGEIEMSARAALQSRAVAPPTTTPEAAAEELTALQKEALRCKAKVDAAEAAVEAAKPVGLIERERQWAENKRTHQNVLGAINRIEV